MKKLFLSLIILIACNNSPQTAKEKFLEGKTFVAYLGTSCDKPENPVKGKCYSRDDYMEISFKNSSYILKDFTNSCGKINVNLTQKGNWKINGKKIIFSPQVIENRNVECFFTLNDEELVAENKFHKIKFALKK